MLDSCWHANHVRMIEPFPVYRTLKQIFSLIEAQGEGALSYLSGQYLADLLTWYHLAWTGETVRRSNASGAAAALEGRALHSRRPVRAARPHP